MTPRGIPELLCPTPDFGHYQGLVLDMVYSVTQHDWEKVT
jgi:hypothetical protein